MLWREGSSVATWPSDALDIGFIIPPPDEMTDSVEYDVSWYAAIRTSEFNLTQYAVETVVWDVPHSNLHSCLAEVGFCTPFVSNTPGLSTHSPALVDNFQPDQSRGETWMNLTFRETLQLDAASYTIIAHARYFTIEAGALVKYDMAQAVVRRVDPPIEICEAGKFKVDDGGGGGRDSGGGGGGCRECPSGFFSDSFNAENCTACAAGKFASDEAEDTDGSGVASGAVACPSCPEGTYSSSNATTICSLCPAALGFSSSGGSRSCDSCLSGYYFDVGLQTCKPCPAHANCPGGEDFYVLPGFWHTSADSTNIFECSQGNAACVGADPESNKTADDYLCGIGYSGVLC